MATRRGETKSTAVRRSASRANTKNSRTVSKQVLSEQEAVLEGQAKADLRQQVYVRATNTSLFQLRAEREELRPDGFRRVLPDKWLRWGTRPVLPIEGEELEILEAILDGTYSDGRVTSKDWQRLARQAGIHIIYPGLVARPTDVWDALPDSQVVPVSVAANVLKTVEDVELAILYEEQSPKRKPAREPREAVVAELEELKESFAARAGVQTKRGPGRPRKAEAVAEPAVAGGLEPKSVEL